MSFQTLGFLVMSGGIEMDNQYPFYNLPVSLFTVNRVVERKQGFWEKYVQGISSGEKEV